MISPITILAILYVGKATGMSETVHRDLINAAERERYTIRQRISYMPYMTSTLKDIALTMGCPTPWILYGKLCLLSKGRNDMGTWREADKWCKSNGGYIVYFQNKKEYDDLYTFVKLRLAREPFHIGIHTLASEYPPTALHWDSGLVSDDMFLQFNKKTDLDDLYYSALISDKNNDPKKYHVEANNKFATAQTVCRRFIREEISLLP